jgi:aldose 1-epimerase
MAFEVRTETRDNTSGLDGTVYVLEDPQGWPALGFNCFRWRVMHGGKPWELLYADDNLFAGGRPTRSGIPILFPFPNRIRDGKYSWAGKDYQLPPNDPAGTNAIHGFACRKPWRVVKEGSDNRWAWVTAVFHGSQDAPETRDLWPADYRLQVTYQLGAHQLNVEALVINTDSKPLPFGLGYHPYFRLPSDDSGEEPNSTVQAPAASYWELVENLPTGTKLPVDPPRDLNKPRAYRELELDDVLTDLQGPKAGRGLRQCGVVAIKSAGGELQLWAEESFRDLVAFTPPHRQAVCLEPYTCTTDAINLQQRGVEAGLRVLPPGDAWRGVVELVVK